MSLEKKTLLDCNQLEALCDQSKSSEPPQLPNYSGRTNFISRSTSRSQPVLPSTSARSRQGRSSNVDTVPNTTLAEHKFEDNFYDEIG